MAISQYVENELFYKIQFLLKKKKKNKNKNKSKTKTKND